MADAKNVLVIGNGFDIAHGLPTTYKDFLDYVEKVEACIDVCKILTVYSYIDKEAGLTEVVEKKDELKKINVIEPACLVFKKEILASGFIQVFGKYDESTLDKIISHSIQNTQIDEYNAVLARFFADNLWYDYFKDKIKNNTMKGETWIDFEGEISNVVKKIEENNLRGYRAGEEPKTITDLLDMIDSDISPYPLVGEHGFIKKLKRDLDLFVRVLEFYLILIDLTPFRKVDLIKQLKIDYLLSFNYTNIYLRANYRTGGYDNYFAPNCIEFIHGQAFEHNLVLGTEETLEEKDSNKDISCIQFKKYFQRIYKKTGLKYKDWFSKDATNKIIYIFGHSLDISDGDVLKYIITKENVIKVNVYYHDDDSHIKEITNLVKVIGKSKLIQMVGNGQINFIDQNELQSYEIAR